MANGITDKGAPIKRVTGTLVTSTAGLYNGTRVMPVADYDFDTGLPVSSGSGTAGGITADGRRIQAVALTEGTGRYVEKYDWATGALASTAPGAGLSTIADGIQSWWMTDAAEVFSGRLTIGGTTAAKEQIIAEVDVATGLTIETKALLTGFWRQDDHSQTPFKRLLFASQAGVLYSMMTGHGATDAAPGVDDHTFYECWSTTGRIADFTAPRTIANTIGRSNLIQLFEQPSSGHIWALTCDDIAPQKWLALHKTSYSAVATQKRAFLQQSAAPGGGQNQVYMRACNPSADVLRMFVTAHATNLQNPLRCGEFDMATGVVTSASGTLQDIDTAVGALPEATDFAAIYTPPAGKSLRLLDVSDDGTMVAFSQWTAADGTGQEYYVLVYDGSGSFFDSANWTARKVCDAGANYMWPDSFYSYGMSFARETHSGLRVVYARRSGTTRYLARGDSADAGATWTETVIESGTTSFFRPHSPVGATASMAVVRSLVTAYTDYLAWSSSIGWKSNSPETALAITTTSIPDPVQGSAYSQALVAVGGTQPVTSWAVTTGTLPAGLSISATTGTISGTPSAAGAYSFTVTATDPEGRTDAQAYSGTVTAPGVLFFDDFNSATGGILDGRVTNPTANGTWVKAAGGTGGDPLVSATTTGSVRPSSTATQGNFFSITQQAIGSGVYAEFKVRRFTNINQVVGVIAQHTNSFTTKNGLGLDVNPSTNAVRIFKYIANTITTIATHTIAFADLDVFTLECRPNEQKIYHNGSLLGTYTEPTDAAWGDHIGVRISTTSAAGGSSVGVHIDEFECGTLA